MSKTQHTPCLKSDRPIPWPIDKRIAEPLFDLVRAGESGAVVGLPGMGKSRLLQFLSRQDVQRHYLGDAAPATWLVLVDCNRLAEVSEWGLYELMLTALTETVSARIAPALRDWLNDLRLEVITSGNALLARRQVELATRVLCQDHGFKLCIIFDEFDGPLSSLPLTALANLRALRDADRYSICFLLMLRDHPARLRSRSDIEGFYELLSRSVLGLKHYTDDDARRVIAQIAARRRQPVTSGQQNELLALSGGHPGLLVALIDVLLRDEAEFSGDESSKQSCLMATGCRRMPEAVGWSGARRAISAQSAVSGYRHH